MALSKPKLRHADILLRCSKDEHKGCKALRDSLLYNFENITGAYTTRTVMDTDYCVGASAFVKDGEIREFEKRLKALKSDGRQKFKVSKLKLFISRQSVSKHTM